MSENIEKLESHLAHLERQIEQLNEVVVGQVREIDLLKKQLGRISQSLENAEADRIRAVDSKPPHYQ